MKLNPELLKIALGVTGCCLNAGFISSYILSTAEGEGKPIPTREERDAKARAVVEHLDDLVRKAQREQGVMNDRGSMDSNYQQRNDHPGSNFRKVV